MSTSINKPLCWVVDLVLCTAFVALVLDVRAARAAPGQIPTEVLHVPELDTGFRLLYELTAVQISREYGSAIAKTQHNSPSGSLRGGQVGHSQVRVLIDAV